MSVISKLLVVCAMHIFLVMSGRQGNVSETKAYDIERDKIIFSRDVVINKTIENEQDTRTVDQVR